MKQNSLGVIPQDICERKFEKNPLGAPSNEGTYGHILTCSLLSDVHLRAVESDLGAVTRRPD